MDYKKKYNEALENFVDIQGYEGFYKINTSGDVLSVRSGKLLKAGKNKQGYMNVVLSKDGKAKTHKVHRLVALAFIPNPNNYPFINHKDENKTNNRVENLEWCNHSMNLVHAYRNGLNKNERPVERLLDGKVVEHYRSAAEAEKEGFQRRLIAKCCKGKRKHHGGFEWRYAI